MRQADGSIINASKHSIGVSDHEPKPEDLAAAYSMYSTPTLYSDAIVGTFAAERAAKLRTHAAGLNTMTILNEPINLRSEIYSGMG